MLHHVLAALFRAEQERSEAARYPRRARGLTNRPMVLTDRTRVRGGANSRRRTARVWVPR